MMDGSDSWYSNDMMSSVLDPPDPARGFTPGRGWWLIMVVILSIAAHTGHAAMIVVGDHEVAAGGQALIPVMIQRQDGDPDLAGVQLAIQISDGTSGPTIGVVDLITGTIFATNHTGSRDKGSLSRQAFWETTTATGAVQIPSAGVLATIEIDTSGLTSGTFDLTLTSVMGTSTVLLDALANTVVPNQGQEIHGSVTIVPEPTSVWVWAGLGLTWLWRVGRVARCGLSPGS